MTTVYFVRHAEPNYENHNDINRELTWKGKEDRKLVTAFFSDKRVDAILSSPYKRAIQTVEHLADSLGVKVTLVADFRERKVDSGWIENFDGFAAKQWEDFTYKMSDGESLQEVQRRNIRALNDILEEYKGQTLVIGSHGTALSTIVNYYDSNFRYADFQRIQHLMPWIVMFEFVDKKCLTIAEFNICDKNNHGQV